MNPTGTRRDGTYRESIDATFARVEDEAAHRTRADGCPYGCAAFATVEDRCEDCINAHAGADDDIEEPSGFVSLFDGDESEDLEDDQFDSDPAEDAYLDQSWEDRFDLGD